MCKDILAEPSDRSTSMLILFADKYRSQARILAWYDADGEPSSHNPFKRVRRHRRKSSAVELENALTPRRTEGDVPLSEEQRRRSEMNGGLGGPRHAATFSAEPSNFDGPPRPTSNDQSEPAEPSMRSTEPINLSSSGEGGVGSGQPRKRRGFLGKFGRHSDSDESLSQTDSRKSNSDTPKFTVGGQLKATIFSSYINVLLVCAPAGSETPRIFLRSRSCKCGGLTNYSCPQLRPCEPDRGVCRQFHRHRVRCPATG